MELGPTFRLKLTNKPNRIREVELQSLGTTARAWSDVLSYTALMLANDRLKLDDTNALNDERQARSELQFHWVVTNIQVASLDIAAEPVVQSEANDLQLPDDFWNDVSRYLAVNMERLESGESPDDVFPAPLVRPVYELLSTFHQNGVGTLEFGYEGQWTTQLSWDHAGLLHRSEIRETSIGSIEGRLTSISFSNRPQFGLRPARGNIVQCHFDESLLLSQVTQALRKRVSVSGRLVRDGDGRPVRVSNVKSIELLPEDDELSSVGELFGSMPELTEDMPTSEWLRMQRGQA